MIVLCFFVFLQLDPATMDAFMRFFRENSHYRADFVQTTESAFLEPTTSSGTIWIQQPGQFKMVYQKGEAKKIVCDGKTYFEEDFLAETQSYATMDDIRDDPLIRVLVYGENLQTFFLIDRFRDEEGKDHFRLRPRQDDSYHIEMTFSDDWIPISITYETNEGEKTHFQFSHFTNEITFSEDDFKVPEPTNQQQ